MPRKILHLDLDAFFCAVEEQHNPALVGKPFAVGGRPEERGVVASCSYPARIHGVRSAMPMARALRLCPGLVIVPSRHGVYSQVSHQVMERLRMFSPLIEQVSIDEAFLDVSDQPEPGEEIARRLQQQINTELDLPCSIGIASNKLVAKIANDVGKAADRSGKPPNTITNVPVGQEAEFLSPLPVEHLLGVGPKTAERLSQIGIQYIGDLARRQETELAQLFGKPGGYLYKHSRGIDDSPLVTFHEPKSISQETTFTKDVNDEQILRRTLRELSENVGKQLRMDGYSAVTIKLKLRWPDFTTVTRQTTLPSPVNLDNQILKASEFLFEKNWHTGKLVRLIGVGVTGLCPPTHQLGLWDDLSEVSGAKDRKLQEALDEVRRRFGTEAIRRGSDFEDLE